MVERRGLSALSQLDTCNSDSLPDTKLFLDTDPSTLTGVLGLLLVSVQLILLRPVPLAVGVALGVTEAEKVEDPFLSLPLRVGDKI